MRSHVVLRYRMAASHRGRNRQGNNVPKRGFRIFLYLFRRYEPRELRYLGTVSISRRHGGPRCDRADGPSPTPPAESQFLAFLHSSCALSFRFLHCIATIGFVNRCQHFPDVERLDVRRAAMRLRDIRHNIRMTLMNIHDMVCIGVTIKVVELPRLNGQFNGAPFRPRLPTTCEAERATADLPYYRNEMSGHRRIIRPSQMATQSGPDGSGSGSWDRRTGPQASCTDDANRPNRHRVATWGSVTRNGR